MDTAGIIDNAYNLIKDYVDASTITLSDMGSMEGSMGSGDMPSMPDGFDTSNMPDGFDASNMTAWIWLAVSVVVLAIGLIVAKKYRI